MVLCFSVERKSKEEEDTRYIWTEEKKGEKSGVFYDKLENAHQGRPPPRNLSAILAYSGESTINYRRFLWHCKMQFCSMHFFQQQA